MVILSGIKALRVTKYGDVICQNAYELLMIFWSSIYNMSGRVVSDIQTRAEGERLYIRYNTAAHVVNSMWSECM